jgi:hypothetical protein
VLARDTREPSPAARLYEDGCRVVAPVLIAMWLISSRLTSRREQLGLNEKTLGEARTIRVGAKSLR